MSYGVGVKKPDEFPGLWCWHDSTDYATLTNGTDVATIVDKTGNGRNWVSAVASKMKKQTLANGNTVLRSNGVADQYNLNFVLLSMVPFTMFYVSRFIVSGDNSIFGCDAGGGSFEIGRSVAGNLILTQSSISSLDTGKNGTEINQLSAVIQNTSANRLVRVNRVNVTPVPFNTLNTITKLYLNWRGFATNSGQQDFYEFIIFNRALNTTEIALMERYLKFKWALL